MQLWRCLRQRGCRINAVFDSAAGVRDDAGTSEKRISACNSHKLALTMSLTTLIFAEVLIQLSAVPDSADSAEVHTFSNIFAEILQTIESVLSSKSGPRIYVE